MTRRVEFPEPIKRAIRLRAAGRCEAPGCGRKIGITRGDHQIHHLILAVWCAGRDLTADDGAVWCTPCHKERTRVDNAAAKRASRVARKIGVDRDPSTDKPSQWPVRPIPGSRASGWRKPMRGEATRRSRNHER